MPPDESLQSRTLRDQMYAKVHVVTPIAKVHLVTPDAWSHRAILYLVQRLKLIGNIAAALMRRPAKIW